MHNESNTDVLNKMQTHACKCLTMVVSNQRYEVRALLNALVVV